jgi:xylan 1,4-beta-xylosidase
MKIAVSKIKEMRLKLLLIGALSLGLANDFYAQTTYCNPININYRFCIKKDNWGRISGTQSYREGADPTILVFKKEYYLFVSKSGGYWHSKDMIAWDFITTNDLPWEEYAPTAVEMNGEVYFMAAGQKLYKTADPKSGKWTYIRNYSFSSFTDPCLYLDDDKKMYLYYGSADNLPLYGIELDTKNNFEPIGKIKPMMKLQLDQYGWENKGEDRLLDIPNPWLEGAWVNKYKGKYYFQYASPLQGKEYNDAVYIGDHPLGPYTIAKHNPYAYKATGFAFGAGHGNTFQDNYGNYWHTGTVGVNIYHLFERRINMIPAGFDKENNLYSNSYLADYPHYIPNKDLKGNTDLFTGWMLLSYNKKVEASSVLDSYNQQNAVDENIRSFWSAKTGEKNEWLSLDLEKAYNVRAIQINFADKDTELLGRAEYTPYQYVIEYSNDKKNWTVLVDKRNNVNDYSHDYFELPKAVKGRYFKITNYHTPDGKFAISGFRIFGKGNDKLPNRVANIKVERKETDRKQVTVSWDKVPNATGYIVRYGLTKDKMYLNHQVYADTSATILSLDKNAQYVYTVDAFNESGITKGK